MRSVLQNFIICTYRYHAVPDRPKNPNAIDFCFFLLSPMIKSENYLHKSGGRRRCTSADSYKRLCFSAWVLLAVQTFFQQCFFVCSEYSERSQHPTALYKTLKYRTVLDYCDNLTCVRHVAATSYSGLPKTHCQRSKCTGCSVCPRVSSSSLGCIRPMLFLYTSGSPPSHVMSCPRVPFGSRPMFHPVSI